MNAESFLLVTITSPVRVVVIPCEDGKLRRGGGGGGDLEGFSVRYLGTVSSSENNSILYINLYLINMAILLGDERKYMLRTRPYPLSPVERHSHHADFSRYEKVFQPGKLRFL